VELCDADVLEVSTSGDAPGIETNSMNMTLTTVPPTRTGRPIRRQTVPRTVLQAAGRRFGASRARAHQALERARWADRVRNDRVIDRVSRGSIRHEPRRAVYEAKPDAHYRTTRNPT
jgi:hypothetical protein